MKTKREAISYGRFSSKPQEKGDSQRRQREAFDRICTRYADKLEASNRFGFGVLFDHGKSGYHGKHLEQGGALRSFLDKLKSGEIDPKTSALCIDEWSRFSRIEPDLGVKLLSDIVRCGCPVIIHNPDMWVDNLTISSPQFIIISFMLQQAHSAGKEKSDWKRESWNGFRERGDGMVKAGRKTSACPSWISPNGTAFVLNSKAPLLRQAALLSIAGYGATEIRRTLGKENARDWAGLVTCFRQRTLIGEYQPMKREGGKKIKTGDAIEGFYPHLLTQDEFNRLQSSLDSRRKQKAKRGVYCTSLFTGLTFADNRLLIIRRTNAGKAILKARGRGKQLDYAVVETGLLDLFLDLTPADLLPVEQTADRATELQALIADKTNKLEPIMAEYDLTGSAFLLKKISAYEDQIKALETELNAEQVKCSVSKCDTLGDTQDLVAHLAGLTGQELLDARLRLLRLIATLVARIDLTIHHSKSCGIVLTLANGREVRRGETSKGGRYQVSMREAG